MPDKIEAAIDERVRIEHLHKRWSTGNATVRDVLVEAYAAGYRAGLGAEKNENGLKQLTPTPECECELRNRQWNGYGKCLTCKRRYKAPYPYKQ